MTDAFYTDLRDNVANELIKEFGSAMTLRVPGGDQVFDGATGFVTSQGTPTDYAVSGVRTQYKKSEINGTNVKDGDFQVILAANNRTTSAALAVVPDTSMEIIDGGSTYKIVRVEPIQPGNVNVIYKLQVR